ncbi:MAG: methylated-DNA--[protein]-cysteine S-methyltransferase [Acidobacteria bacterium]|nr:methylated-DNA--[protein]-cysteine S-methyltransferase [Acidobacteriota bacterium]
MLRWSEVDVADGLRVRVAVSVAGLRSIEFPPARPIEGERTGADPLIAETARQLRAYFTGALRRFDLPLDMQGTPFQQRVWRQLQSIPYGETRSYRQVAAAIGAPAAVRAVGAANGANPVPIVVPCHRVIGAGGKLVGYGGGLELKQRLLELEGARSAPLGY